MSFSLFRLPNKVIRNVLLNMNELEGIFISLLSARAKNIVADLKMKEKAIISDDFGSFEIMECDNTMTINWNFGFENDRPISIYAQYGEEPLIRWRNQENMTLRQYLTHFMSIFMLLIPDTIHAVTCWEGYPFYCIQGLICGLKVWQFEIKASCSDRYVNNTLKGLHLARCVELERISYRDTKILPKIFIQNFDQLYFWDEIRMNLTLNNLLNMNCLIIRITGPNFTGKELNRFLKLWKSGCNPRLEELSINYREQVLPDHNMITKGVHFMELRDNAEKEYQSTVFGETGILKNGYSIWNKDGIEAVISIKYESCFTMNVLY